MPPPFCGTSGVPTCRKGVRCLTAIRIVVADDQVLVSEELKRGRASTHPHSDCVVVGRRNPPALPIAQFDTTCVRIAPSESADEKMVSRIFASLNQIGEWLRRVDGLRHTA